MKAWKMEAAEAVVEFAKSQGFPHASWFLWDEEGEHSYDSADLAVDDMENGHEAGFQLNITLGHVRLRQELIENVNGADYSNGVEVPSERTLP